MNSEPAKRDGKMKEQVEIEHEVRRRYQRKWGDVLKDPRINFYNIDKLNAALEKLNGGEVRLYEYTNSGESYFVSKDMFTSLMLTCRCGRPRVNAHSLKCLQKCKNRYLDDSTENDKNRFLPVPTTSMGVYGWPKNRFNEWEMSTRYVSPKYDMPGGPIDGHPYSNPFIG